MEVTKKIYTAIDPTRPIYDVALDQFEKGITAAHLDTVFSQVPPLVPSPPPAFPSTYLHVLTAHTRVCCGGEVEWVAGGRVGGVR